MGKNFDEEGTRVERLERDRTFVIGGGEFRYDIGLTPEEFNDRITPFTSLPDNARSETTLPAIDEAIRNLLSTDEDRERWMELRQRRASLDEAGSPADLAITAGDMREVFFFMLEEQTGRPTRAPSSSGGGRGNGGQRSTERSSSVVVASGDSLD